MQWFRFYGEAVNDPKVQSLPGDLFKTWVNILCLASQHNGQVKIDLLPFLLRCHKSVTDPQIGALRESGLIKVVGYYIIPNGWEKRQYKSDTSKERTRRYRDRTCDVTESVTVTAPEQIQNQKEKNTKKETYSMQFETFWGVYPRKVAKGLAAKAFDTACIARTSGFITERAAKFALSCKGKDPEFIPHPATWLNQKRYDDEVNPPKTSTIHSSNPIKRNVEQA